MDNNAHAKECHKRLFQEEFKKTLIYLISERFFSEDAIKRFQLGVELNGMITIPIIKEEKVLGIRLKVFLRKIGRV